MKIVAGMRVKLPSGRTGVVKIPDFNGRAVVRYEMNDDGLPLKEWMRDNEVVIHRELLSEIKDEKASASR